MYTASHPARGRAASLLLALMSTIAAPAAARADGFYASVAEARKTIEEAARGVERPRWAGSEGRGHLPNQIVNQFYPVEAGQASFDDSFVRCGENDSIVDCTLTTAKALGIALVEDFRIVGVEMVDNVKHLTLESASGVLIMVEATRIGDEAYLKQLGVGVARGAGRIAGVGAITLVRVGVTFFLVAKEALMGGFLTIVAGGLAGPMLAYHGVTHLDELVVQRAYRAAGVALRMVKFALVKTDEGLALMANQLVDALKAGKTAVVNGWRYSAQAVKECAEACTKTFRFFRTQISPRDRRRMASFRQLQP